MRNDEMQSHNYEIKSQNHETLTLFSSYVISLRISILYLIILTFYLTTTNVWFVFFLGGNRFPYLLPSKRVLVKNLVY